MSEQRSRLVIEIDTSHAERNARAIARELESIERNGNFATKSMDNFSVATRQLAGYMAGIVTVSAAINKIDTYTNLSNQLTRVTNNQQELNQALDDTYKIALRSAASWEAVNSVYVKYLSNSKTLNITQAESARLTEITAKAVAMSGSTAQAAAGALFQYGQALDGNILQAEEFNSLVDGAGGLLDAMAKGLGVTRGELRRMMLDGKLTGEVITQALLKAGNSVDQLYSKSQKSIGQALTMLGDAITKFTGEAASSSGTAAVLAESIATLAENLDLVANTAAIAGIGLLTKYLLEQGVVIKQSIANISARIAAQNAEGESQIRLAALEVQRTRAAAAMAAQEIHLARQELNSATTREARAAATMRLTQAEVAYNIAVKQATAAVTAQAAAESALNSTRTVGARALAMVGGPIGAITLGVTALSAGYLLLANNTNASTSSLRENNEAVGDAIKKYQELTSVQQASQLVAEKEKLGALEKEYTKASSALAVFATGMSQSNDVVTQSQVELEKLFGEYRKTGDLEKFNQAVQSSEKINQKTKDEVAKLAANIETAGNAARDQKNFISQLGQNIESAGNKAKATAGEVSGLTEKIKELFREADKTTQTAKITAALASRGYDDELISIINKYAAAEGAITVDLKGQSHFRDEIKAKIREEYQAVLKAKEAVDARNAAEKERTGELQKQQAILKASSQVLANAAKYNFAGLESKYNLPTGALTAIHAIETGNSGKTNQVNKTTGAAGGFQFMPGTAGRFKIDPMNMQQASEAAAKYLRILLDMFNGDLEKAVRAYHAGEGNVQRGTNLGKYNNDYWKKFKGFTAGSNGYSAGDLGSRDWEKMLEESVKFAEQQAQLRKTLEQNVADEVTRIRNKLNDDLKEIDKAGFSEEQTKKLKAEYEQRAENEIALANYALKTKVDDYKAFQKTEEDLLRESFDQRKFYAARDLELTKDQRKEAVLLLDEQLQQELALLRLAQEQRLFQAKQILLSETTAMEERYRLEREQIMQNSKLSQEQKLKEIELSKLAQQEELRNKTNDAKMQWGQTQAEMMGVGDLFRIEQDRFSQYDQSQKIFDNELAQTNLDAQDPTADMQEIAKRREEIWQAHHERMEQIEKNYQLASAQSQLGSLQSISESMTGILGMMAGKQSGAYKAMFAASKGFAIAQAGLNFAKAYSDAFADPTALTMPQKLANYAIMASNAMSIMQNLMSIKGEGFANGGFTGYGGKFEPAGIVHKGEGVLNQEEIRAIGGESGFNQLRQSIRNGYANGGIVADTKRLSVDAVNAIGGGFGSGVSPTPNVNIVIENHSNSDVRTSVDQDGKIRVIVRDEIDKYVPGQMTNPNSRVHKSIVQNTTASTKR